MQQIIQRQKVVDEYRMKMMVELGLIPLDSNLHKTDLVIISQIMQMIDVHNFWHRKTCEAVLTNLQRRWDEVIHKQKDMSTHCTENSEINDEMKKQTKNIELHNGKESTRQERQDKMKSKTIARLESKKIV